MNYVNSNKLINIGFRTTQTRMYFQGIKINKTDKIPDDFRSIEFNSFHY
jgi:hypothetical protein